MVELPVLGPQERLVVPAEPVEDLAAEGAEVDRRRRPLLAADVEARLADADPAGHGGGHSALEVGHPFGSHQPADVVGAGARQRLDRDPHVVRGHQRVPVEADDDLVPGHLERPVEPRSGRAGRVGDQPDPLVRRGQRLGDLVGPVAGGTEREHDLQRAGVVLAEHGGHRREEVLLLVEDRHHDGDARQRSRSAGRAADTAGHGSGDLRRACPGVGRMRPSLVPRATSVVHAAPAPEPARSWTAGTRAGDRAAPELAAGCGGSCWSPPRPRRPCVLVVAASGYALVSWSARSIDRVDAFAGLSERPAPNAAGSTTFLLVGSDGRTGMSKADMRRLHVGTAATAAGRRADTMLLVHVSAERGTVRVVSLPRDSYVTIPAHTGTDGSDVPERRNKLNAAYAFGGPPLDCRHRRAHHRGAGRPLPGGRLPRLRPAGRRRRRRGRVHAGAAARPQGRTAAAEGHQPRRRGDRAGLRARPQPRRPRRPRPGREAAAVPGRDGPARHQQRRAARPPVPRALPGRGPLRGPGRPRPHQAASWSTSAPGSGTCRAATSGSRPCRSPTPPTAHPTARRSPSGTPMRPSELFTSMREDRAVARDRTPRAARPDRAAGAGAGAGLQRRRHARPRHPRRRRAGPPRLRRRGPGAELAPHRPRRARPCATTRATPRASRRSPPPCPARDWSRCRGWAAPCRWSSAASTPGRAASGWLPRPGRRPGHRARAGGRPLRLNGGLHRGSTVTSP